MLHCSILQCIICTCIIFFEFSKTEITEMQNEFFEKMTEAGKSSFATMQAFGEINTKVLKELSELQISLASYSIESGVELTKTLSSTKDYKGFFVNRS